MKDSTYLGDSVYAQDDGHMVRLVTWNGYPDDPRNEIFLESSVIQSLMNFIEQKRNVKITVERLDKTRNEEG